MSDDRTACPDVETLGAFLDARLEGEERDAVVAHFATCDLCIAGAELVARMRREEEPSNVVPMAARSRKRFWLSVAAALAILVAGAALVQQFRARQRPGIDTLIAAAPVSHRNVEPRLTGFRWAELQRLRDEARPADPETLRLGGAAAEVLVRAEKEKSAAALHAAGVAEILLQQPDEAIERLRDVAENGGSAAVWNDLAAAYYTAAMRDGRHAELPRALAAADRALALDDALHEARFNRALILERMGLHDAASAAWRAYLARDPSSPWAAEARRRAEALSRNAAPSARLDFERLERLAAARDAAGVDALVAAHAQEARAWFEVDVLGRWGEAVLRGDTDAASTLLASAAETAAALQRTSGESLLAGAVHSIETSNPSGRRALADAHAIYKRARLLYRDRRLEEATASLLDAARRFDAARSPMQGVARYFAAATLFDRNRVAEAAAMLAEIAPAPRHDALRAQVAERRAACLQYEGRWEEAMRGFAEAAALFARLGESANAASAEANVGHTLDELGARDEAWRHRIAALARAQPGPRRIAALAAAARSEIRAEEYEAARALLAIEAEETEALGDPLLSADVWRRRALVDAELGDEAAALASVARCRALMARAPASAIRERVAAESELAEGTAILRRDPERAIVLLGRATEFLVRADHRIALADAHLARGRALRAAGRDPEALAAFRAGLDEVEAQRRLAPAGSSIFDTAAPLAEELIALQLARGDAAGALATAERTRARSILDDASPPATLAEIVAALPPRTLLVTYALVPDGVAAISVSRDRVAAARQRIPHRALARAVRALHASLAARAGSAIVTERASLLGELLLDAVPGVRQAESLVIVPDRLLYSVPWAALYDAEEKVFAIERHALTIAPSASVWLRKRGAPARGATLLTVTGGADGRLDPLERAAAEGAAVAQAYRESVHLAGNEATASRFLSMAAGADVIHFAGHARTGALLLANGSELSAAEIARARLDRPRLVVLAACGTAAGAGEGFDGPRGLGRAFLTAGAAAVVATLWPVDDAEASTLFVEFHRRLRGGESASAALRHAQLALLRGNAARARHPAAWAAPALFGADVTFPAQ